MVGGPEPANISTTSTPPTRATSSAGFRRLAPRMPKPPCAPPPRHSTGWKKTPVSMRARILNRAADYLEANADRFAAELTREQGKPLNLAKDEILRSAQTLRFYAVEGQSFTGETFPNDDTDMVVYTPARAAGRGVRDHPLEFPGLDSGAQDRAGADHRQYSRLQAVVGRAAERLSPRRGLGRGRHSEGRAQFHHRQRRPTSARPSPSHRSCAPFPSPAPPPPANRSIAPWRSPRARRWSSAARTR